MWVPNLGPNLVPSSEPNLRQTVEPNLKPNHEPNLRPNLEPNLKPNHEPNLRPNLEPNIQLNEGAGPGIDGTQRLAIPCSDFRNTENHERVENTDQASNLEINSNMEQSGKFKSTDDILQIMKTHPDFERLPPDNLQPIIAGIISGMYLHM